MDVDGGGHLLNVHLTSCLLLLVWLYHAYCYYSCPWIYDRFFFLFICIVRELFRKFCNYMQNNIPMMIAIDSHKKLLWIKTINIQTHTHMKQIYWIELMIRVYIIYESSFIQTFEFMWIYSEWHIFCRFFFIEFINIFSIFVEEDLNNFFFV